MAAVEHTGMLGDEPLAEAALSPETQVTPTAALPTAALSDAAVPRTLRLAPELSDEEKESVDEALARGVGVIDATLQVAQARGVPLELKTLTDEIVGQPEPEAALTESPDLAALPLALSVLERERTLRETIKTEFKGFPPHVRAAFQSTAALNGVFTDLESYRFIRSRLWQQGRRNAGALFHDIVGKDEGARLLGREIQNGAHRILVEKLAPLREAPQGATVAILNVVGFQPRRIEGSESLSNHVFGLAIDIDAAWNPNIKSREAIEVILRHTGVDFGKPLLVAGADLEGIYSILHGASNALRNWLRTVLPVEGRLRGAVEEMTRRTQAAEAAVRRARTEAEKRAAAAALEQARKDLRKAQGDLSASMEAFEVGELAKEFGRPVVEQWESRGLFTIPIDLARRLKDLGFDWGAEWTTHKDVMHFELNPAELLPP